VPLQRSLPCLETHFRLLCEVIGEGVVQCAYVVGNLEDRPGCGCVIQTRFERFKPSLHLPLQHALHFGYYTRPDLIKLCRFIK
jgi:hypothetical protein